MKQFQSKSEDDLSNYQNIQFSQQSQSSSIRFSHKNETGRKLYKNNLTISLLKQSVQTDDNFNSQVISNPDSSQRGQSKSKFRKWCKKLKKCSCLKKKNTDLDQSQILELSVQNSQNFHQFFNDGEIKKQTQVANKQRLQDNQNNQQQQQNQFVQEQQNDNKMIQFITKYIQISIFEPENTYLLVWEFFIQLMTLFYFVVIPLQIGFWLFIDVNDSQESAIKKFQIGVNIFIFLFLLADLFLHFNVGFYQKGLLTVDRSKIIKEYVNSWGLYINLLTLAVPLNDIIRQDSSSVFINLIFFLKISNIINFNHKIIRRIQLKRGLKFLYQMLRLVFIIFFIGHVMACFYFGVSYYVSTVTGLDSWLDQNQAGKDLYNDLQSSWWIVYLWTLYWSMTTMVSGGYGDIGCPMNVYEAVFMINYDALVYVAFAFFMNVIWDYIAEFRWYSEKYEYQKSSIYRYMKNKQTDANLQYKVDAYMEYFMKKNQAREEDQEEQVISKLPPKLKDELIYDANGYFLDYVPWIKNNFSDQFLKKLGTKVEEMNLLEDDLIIDNSTPFEEEDTALFYVESGKVEGYFDLEIYNEGRGLPLGRYRAGDMFNAYYFIINQQNPQNFRALQYSTVYRITRKNFLDCLEDLQDDKEKFYQIQNEVLFKENLQVISYACRLCHSENHISAKCPQIVFTVNRSQLAQENQIKEEKRYKFKEIFPEKEERTLFKQNTLEKLKDIQESQELLLEDLEEEVQEEQQSILKKETHDEIIIENENEQFGGEVQNDENEQNYFLAQEENQMYGQQLQFEQDFYQNEDDEKQWIIESVKEQAEEDEHEDGGQLPPVRRSESRSFRGEEEKNEQQRVKEKSFILKRKVTYDFNDFSLQRQQSSERSDVVDEGLYQSQQIREGKSRSFANSSSSLKNLASNFAISARKRNKKTKKSVEFFRKESMEEIYPPQLQRQSSSVSKESKKSQQNLKMAEQFFNKSQNLSQHSQQQLQQQQIASQEINNQSGKQNWKKAAARMTPVMRMKMFMKRNNRNLQFGRNNFKIEQYIRQQEMFNNNILQNMQSMEQILLKKQWSRKGQDVNNEDVFEEDEENYYDQQHIITKRKINFNIDKISEYKIFDTKQNFQTINKVFIDKLNKQQKEKELKDKKNVNAQQNRRISTKNDKNKFLNKNKLNIQTSLTPFSSSASYKLEKDIDLSNQLSPQKQLQSPQLQQQKQ